jgi:uncharacterized membrane protein YeiH
VAALGGAVVVVALERAETHHNVVLLVPAALIFGVRLVALLRKWSAPLASGIRSGERGDEAG